MQRSFFLSNSSEAQWSFGIKVTSSSSTYSSGLNPFQKGDPEKVKGLGASVQLYRRISQHFSFGVEPGVAQRGAINPFYNTCFGFCGTGADFSTFPYNSASIYSNYAQLPFFAQYKTALLKSKLELFGKAGAGISYAVSAYQQSDLIYRYQSIGSDIEPIKFEEMDGFNRWDAGLHAGVGIGWRFCFGVVSLETEVYQGLANLHIMGFKNRTRGVSLGYRLDL